MRAGGGGLGLKKMGVGRKGAEHKEGRLDRSWDQD
jgi:hypothetical protein